MHPFRNISLLKNEAKGNYLEAVITDIPENVTLELSLADSVQDQPHPFLLFVTPYETQDVIDKEALITKECFKVVIKWQNDKYVLETENHTYLPSNGIVGPKFWRPTEKGKIVLGEEGLRLSVLKVLQKGTNANNLTVKALKEYHGISNAKNDFTKVRLKMKITETERIYYSDPLLDKLTYGFDIEDINIAKAAIQDEGLQFINVFLKGRNLKANYFCTLQIYDKEKRPIISSTNFKQHGSSVLNFEVNIPKELLENSQVFCKLMIFSDGQEFEVPEDPFRIKVDDMSKKRKALSQDAPSTKSPRVDLEKIFDDVLELQEEITNHGSDVQASVQASKVPDAPNENVYFEDLSLQSLFEIDLVEDELDLVEDFKKLALEKEKLALEKEAVLYYVNFFEQKLNEKEEQIQKLKTETIESRDDDLNWFIKVVNANFPDLEIKDKMYELSDDKVVKKNKEGQTEKCSGERSPDQEINVIMFRDSRGMSVEKAIASFLRNATSYHFIIDKYGKVHMLVDPLRKAFFAGKSSWGDWNFLNKNGICIGFVNSGMEDYPKNQITSAAQLVTILCKNFNIDPLVNATVNEEGKAVTHLSVIASGDASPGRNHDVGGHFPWKMFYYELDQCAVNLNLKPTGLYKVFEVSGSNANFVYTEKEIKLFEEMGYRCDTVTDIIQAFNRHFVPEYFTKEKIERVDGVKVVQVLECNTNLSELGTVRLEMIWNLIKTHNTVCTLPNK